MQQDRSAADDEQLPFANQPEHIGGALDIANEDVEVRDTHMDRKRMTDYAVNERGGNRSQAAGNNGIGSGLPEMRQSAGFPQSTLETINTANQSKS